MRYSDLGQDTNVLLYAPTKSLFLLFSEASCRRQPTRSYLPAAFRTIHIRRNDSARMYRCVCILTKGLISTPFFRVYGLMAETASIPLRCSDRLPWTMRCSFGPHLFAGPLRHRITLRASYIVPLVFHAYGCIQLTPPTP